MLQLWDLGLPEPIKPSRLMASIQRRGAQMREAMHTAWRYNDSGAKRKRAAAQRLVGGVVAPVLALAAPPAEVLPERLSNAAALALFAAAQAAGHGKMAVFFNSVNAGQRQQISGEKREVKRLYRRVAALDAGDIKFEPALPFALPAAGPAFIRPTPVTLAVIRSVGRRGAGRWGIQECLLPAQRVPCWLNPQHGVSSQRSAPPPSGGVPS